ncbi:receptor-like protein kinase FERONIA [Magnolia sinica]|uniref:receptor-like protein kinase FERONIA n=1 Tax=Magnolia sinica TaxID=86752 RepID=UPI0026581CE7|nr:receptor-like protein kinase FERONIA [Magnolia sinica]
MKKANRNPLLAISAPLFFHFLFVHLISAATNNSTYVPPDQILLNCGASSQETDTDGRNWLSDVGSKFAPSSTNTNPFKANYQDPSVPTVPYMTARIFTSQFTYTFPVGAGRKFIRLYFYPANYSNFNAANAVFSVNSGPYTLLNNFSSYLTSEALNFAYLTREFSINTGAGFLNLTFIPSPNISNAYAFINGIEVVSTPYIFSFGNLVLAGDLTSTFQIDNSTALQTVIRLNVGGSDVSPVKDSGLFRSWSDDSPYIFGAGTGVAYVKDQNITIAYTPGVPSYIAPLDVYSTARSMGPDKSINQNYNLTWMFPVDAGFTYLVRLHFCEIQSEIFKINQRVFDIFINNQTAEAGADVIGWSGGDGVPVYKDYIVMVQNGNPSPDLLVALHPDVSSETQFYDAILNGLEIFKLNDTVGNLAGPNPTPLPEQNVNPSLVNRSPRSGNSSKNRTPVIIGAAAAAVVVISLICLAFVFFRCRRQGKDSGTSDGPSGWLPLSLYGNSHSAGSAKTGTTGSYASSLPSNLCRHFSFAEIKAATNDFDEALLLGVGGFGKVYKGDIDGGTMKVAIKRGNPLSEQGVHEFQTEIEMLSKLRHRHLVSLIGYCEENCEMILVYDYMAHGTLREHLYKTQKPPLPWKQRLEICIGAARGLHYLHTGAKHTIIHRDVKTTNILLDEKWVAKVSDFGLSKTGPTLDHTHVSTVVKGSFGYLDPEYFRRQQLTEKSDVYSFGVVLFEALCARPALNPTLAKEQVSLAEWALHCQNKGVLDQIIDPYLNGKIAPECFKKFAETAEKCVADQGIDRPAMGDVLWNLEFALQLQESAEESGGVQADAETVPLVHDGITMGKKHLDDSMGFGGNVSDSKSSATTMSIGGRSLASEDSDGLTPSAVFSQIMNPKGR